MLDLTCAISAFLVALFMSLFCSFCGPCLPCLVLSVCVVLTALVWSLRLSSFLCVLFSPFCSFRMCCPCLSIPFSVCSSRLSNPSSVCCSCHLIFSSCAVFAFLFLCALRLSGPSSVCCSRLSAPSFVVLSLPFCSFRPSFVLFLFGPSFVCYSGLFGPFLRVLFSPF